MKINKKTLSTAPYWLMLLVCGGLIGFGASQASRPKLAQSSSYMLVSTAPGHCNYSDFFGLSPWYAYLPCTGKACGNPPPTTPSKSPCVKFTKHDISNADGSTGGGLSATGLGAVWLIALAVLEDLLRIAGFAAVIMVIAAGIRYTMSGGDPQKTQAAKGTIINALIGLTIAIIASASVAYIAGVIG